MRIKVFQGIVVAVIAVGTLFSSADAQTLESLQAQLQALLDQVSILQSQLRTTQQEAASPAPSSVTVTDTPVYYFVATRTLYRGLHDAVTGGEVTELQKFLKSQGDIVYPEGLVTGYFGALTERAVQRWQAVQGLVSSGTPATTGYGVVGPKTRAAMKDFVERTRTFHETKEEQGGLVPSPPVSATVPASTGEKPAIFSITPSTGPVGTPVTIKGSGFTSLGNDVNFAGVSRAIANVSSPDGTTITFTIPATPCAPDTVCAQVVLAPGMHGVSVTNRNGTTDTAFFEITRSSAAPPIIYSISPTSGPPGTLVTIRGTNFSRFGNTVLVGYATLKNIQSPDGKTIQYVHDPPIYDTEDEFNGYEDKEQFVQETLVPLGLTWEEFMEQSTEPHHVYVFTENGESNGKIFYGEPRVRFINPHVMMN